MLFALIFACAASNDSSLLSGCRQQSDCADGSTCFEPGACNAGDEEVIATDCTKSEDCTGELVCQPSLAGCGFTSGAACVDSCVTAGCDSGDSCDAGTGLCAATSCADGFTCPENTTCTADKGDEHGCLRTTCDGDADCDGGVCVNGACFAALGECDWIAP